MAISITRRQALNLKAVMRRAFGNRGPMPAVRFTAAAGTLNARANSHDTAIEYTAPGDGPDDALWVPFQLLDDCGAKRNEPVQVELSGKGCVTAQWHDGSVPQIVQYDDAKAPDADKFPAPPETLAENPPAILQALVAAGESTDLNAVRYAVNCIQLQGTGTINATDGRQLLAQSGFAFPWEGDLLVYPSKAFGSPELAGEGPVQIGRSGDWAAFRAGAWRIWLAVNVDGRFPDVTRHIPRVADATARFALSAADAAFLAQTLPKLPCDDAYNYPLTLDLNGSIAIRAKAADQAKPTEIVLSGSSWSGEPMRLNMNRKFLVRALKLGFSELLFYGPEVPVACHDERRDFVWATLGPETAIPPAEDAIRFESPKDNSAVSISQPVTPRRSKAVSETTPNSNGKAASNGHANTTTAKGKSSRRRTNQQDIAALIEQAIKLRTALHDRTHEAGELVKALKQYRRANRAIQQTLSSIRQLKGLGV